MLSAGLDWSVKNNHESIPAEISTIENPIKKQESIVIDQRLIKTQQFFAKSSNIIAMIAVPFFAFYFWLIFYKKGYNYSEHLVANLLFVSVSNLAFSLVVFPILAFFKNTSFAPFVWLLGFFLQLIYFVIAYKGLMGSKGVLAVFKIVISTLIGLVLWIFLTQLVAAIYVYQNSQFMDYFKRMG